MLFVQLVPSCSVRMFGIGQLASRLDPSYSKWVLSRSLYFVQQLSVSNCFYSVFTHHCTCSQTQQCDHSEFWVQSIRGDFFNWLECSLNMQFWIKRKCSAPGCESVGYIERDHLNSTQMSLFPPPLSQFIVAGRSKRYKKVHSSIQNSPHIDFCCVSMPPQLIPLRSTDYNFFCRVLGLVQVRRLHQMLLVHETLSVSRVGH